MAASRSNSQPERIFLSPPHLSGREMDYVQEAFASNYIAPLGPQVEAFEHEFAAKAGTAHALALSSGTAAIHLSLAALGVGPGDVVPVASLTFIASVSPVVHLGAEPVFIDSDPETWCMDPELLAQEMDSLEAAGRRPKAVIPVDLYGQPADLDRIIQVCAPRGIKVLADSAEALGSEYKGRPTGAGAWASAFSFNGNKIITTSGGGMLASDDGDLLEEARHLSQQARDQAPHYQHSKVGYNFRMSNVLAAIGRGQLEVLEERVARRRWIFDYYRRGLADLPGIDFMPEAEYGRMNRWLSVITVDKDLFGAGPEEIRQALEAENIESRPLWKPMHLQPVFADCRRRGGEVAEGLFDRGLCLPSGTAMSQSDLDRIVNTIVMCRPGS